MAIGIKNNEKIAVIDTDQFSTWELDMLCEADLAAAKKTTVDGLQKADIEQERIRLAKYLINEYTKGSDKTTKDARRVHKLRKEVLKEGAINNPAPGPEWLKSEWLYKGHAWFFTGSRLAVVRVNRIFVYLKRPFLPKWFSYGGLSNGLTFLFDLGIVLKHTFRDHETPDDTRAKRSYFERAIIRCKNALKKGSRAYRMLNDSVWFTINLTVLLLTGPLYLLLNPLLNTIGFLFDTLHEFGWMATHYKRHTRLINKLDERIKDLNAQKLLDPTNVDIDRQIQVLLNMRQHVVRERFVAVRRQAWLTVFCAILMAGMALLYYPPAAISGAFLIGSAIALVAGSVFMGIGRRIYLYIEERYEKITEKINAVFKPLLDFVSTFFATKAKTPAPEIKKDTFSSTSQILPSLKKLPSSKKTEKIEKIEKTDTPVVIQEKPEVSPAPTPRLDTKPKHTPRYRPKTLRTSSSPA